MASQVKHVCFFVPSLGGGGAQRMIVNLADALSSKGQRVDLVLARAEGPYLQSISSRVNVIDLGAKRLRSALWQLVRYLRRERPQVLLATLTSASMLAVVARLLSFTRPTLILRQASAMRRSQRPWLVRRIYPLADAFIALSADIKSDLTDIVGLAPGDVHIIHNPAYRPEIDERASEEVDHPWFTPDRDGPIIIAVGRLIGAKGFGTLLRAFALAQPKTNSRLVILGEGSGRDKLEQLARDLGLSDALWMPGFVDNPFKYLANADVFVLSSQFEPFGNVLVEALAVGTPVVSTDCPGGPREILGGGRWGRLVPVGDEEEMAKAICDTLNSKSIDRTELKERARAFALENIVREYEHVFSTATAG